MGEKDLRISASELHRLEVECQSCKSSIIFEATADRGPGEVSCQNCGAPFPKLGILVKSYRELFAAIQEGDSRVHFLVSLEDD